MMRLNRERGVIPSITPHAPQVYISAMYKCVRTGHICTIEVSGNTVRECLEVADSNMEYYLNTGDYIKYGLVIKEGKGVC